MRAVLDEDAVAADQLFDQRRLLRPGIREADRLLEADIEPAGLQQLRIADDVDRVLEMGLAAVEDHALLPIDPHRARLAQRPVFQVAIEELFHPPGTFHGEQVGAAIDVDVRPGEAHAAAFHVGRLAFDRHLGLRRVGLRGVQPLAGDQQRQIAGQGRLGLLQFHVVDDRDLGQFAMLLVAQEHAGLQQAAADFQWACRPPAAAGSCLPSGSSGEAGGDATRPDLASAACGRRRACQRRWHVRLRASRLPQLRRQGPPARRAPRW